MCQIGSLKYTDVAVKPRHDVFRRQDPIMLAVEVENEQQQRQICEPRYHLRMFAYRLGGSQLVSNLN